MPDNDDDLSRRLSVVEQTFGLRPVNNNQVANQTNEPIQAQHTDNINWKALYKVLESEVESIILDPNAPRYVSEWGQGVMAKLREKLPR